VVLDGNDPAEVERCLRAIGASVRHAQRLGRLGAVEIELGDCEPRRILSDGEVNRLTAVAAAHGVAVVRHHLLEPTDGPSSGNQRLAAGAVTDLLLMLGPDTVAAPNLLLALLEPFERPRVAITEARQMPFEHPKPFDPYTGLTSWASGCGLMIRRDVFELVGGFDIAAFPGPCADVDLSWRVRREGWEVVHSARGALFRDLRHDGTAVAGHFSNSATSRLALVLLARRYHRDDVVGQLLTVPDDDPGGTVAHVRAEYENRQRLGLLPEPLGGVSGIADFEGTAPGGHRFQESTR
jgi:hypothetical protein